MGIAAAATEAKATALITEIRRCLSLGVVLNVKYMRDCLDQLLSATVNDLSGRTNRAADNFLDGRDAAEAAVIA